MCCVFFFFAGFLSVQETVVSEEIMHNLDSCEVSVVGDELDGEHESLEVDVSQLQQRALEMSSSNLGLVITGTQHHRKIQIDGLHRNDPFIYLSFSVCLPGVNTMANYEQVLHLIRYKNWHTEALFDRKFKLVCSELNGRYISNDFKVEVGTLLTTHHHRFYELLTPQKALFERRGLQARPPFSLG